MATLKGTWRFNDVLTAPSGGVVQSVNFTTVAMGYSGVTGSEIIVGVLPELGLHIESVPSELENSLSSLGITLPFTFYVYSLGWEDDYGEGVKTIDFGDELQVVSEVFYNWLTENATQPTTTITYNGNVIASLEAGQTATLPCAGKKMKGDIVTVYEGHGVVSTTHALYNSVKLPVIPQSILSLKTYWMILYRMASNEYYLYGSTNPWYFYSTNAHPSTVDNAGDKCYRYLATANGWSLNSNSYNDYINLGSINQVLWSNHNMPNGSETATEIYFEKSDPAPVIEGYISDGTPLKINYNGVVIATLEEGQTATIPCAGKKMKSDVVVSIVEDSGGATLITFTIEGIEYQAEEGMTWEQWCASEYNTNVYTIDSSNSHVTDGLNYVIGSGGYRMGHQEIDANTLYGLVSSGNNPYE